MNPIDKKDDFGTLERKPKPTPTPEVASYGMLFVAVCLLVVIAYKMRKAVRGSRP